MLNTEIYDILSIVSRNRNILNSQSFIDNRDILQMITNSNIRKTTKNIDAVIKQFVDTINDSNFYESVKVDIKNNIIVKFKEVK